MATENQILLYQTEDGETRLEVLHQDETVWLSQRDMAQLFQVTVPTVNEHIRNIYATGELQRSSTRRHLARTQKEGSREVARKIDHYSLDMAIAVSYRVNSKRATQLRKWAAPNGSAKITHLSSFIANVTELTPKAWKCLTDHEIRNVLADAQKDKDDKVICAGCGCVLPKNDTHIDHAYPRSLGGTDDIFNRVLLCQPCNSRKSNKLTIVGLWDRNRESGKMTNERLAKQAWDTARDYAEQVKNNYQNIYKASSHE